MLQIKKIETKITGIMEISPRVKTFRMSVPRDFTFEAGQFVMVSVPGFDNEKGFPIARSYSIASSPLTKGEIEICLSRAVNGKLSTKLHSLSPGAAVNVTGPYGLFGLKPPVAEGTTFIAAGTGIAPLISMIRTLYLQNFSGEISLFYGTRNPGEFLYREELESYSRKNNLKLLLTASDPNADWDGEKGLISDAAVKRIKRGEFPVYLCGPPLMVADAAKKLKDLGFRDDQIRMEQW